ARLRDEAARQAQVPPRADQLGGVPGGPRHLGGQGQEPSRCPIADRALDEAMLLAQFKFHPTTSASVFVQDADASCGRTAQRWSSEDISTGSPSHEPSSGPLRVSCILKIRREETGWNCSSLRDFTRAQVESR